MVAVPQLPLSSEELHVSRRVRGSIATSSLGEIRIGGMATVYLGNSAARPGSRTVAIKSMHPFAPDPTSHVPRRGHAHGAHPPSGTWCLRRHQMPRSRNRPRHGVMSRASRFDAAPAFAHAERSSRRPSRPRSCGSCMVCTPRNTLHRRRGPAAPGRASRRLPRTARRRRRPVARPRFRRGEGGVRRHVTQGGE